MRGEHCLLHCPTGLSSCGVFAAYLLSQTGLRNEQTHHGGPDEQVSHTNSSNRHSNTTTASAFAAGLAMLRREASPLYVETDSQEQVLNMLIATKLLIPIIAAGDGSNGDKCTVDDVTVNSLITQARPDYIELLKCYKLFVCERIAERLRPRVPFSSSRSPSRRRLTDTWTAAVEATVTKQTSSSPTAVVEGIVQHGTNKDVNCLAT